MKRNLMFAHITDRCAYCGGRYQVDDHVFPESRGGDDTIENRIPACLSCNSRKANRTALEFLLGIAPMLAKPKPVTHCEGCGAPLEVVTNRGKGRPKRYCSSAHKNRAYRARIRQLLAGIRA